MKYLLFLLNNLLLYLVSSTQPAGLPQELRIKLAAYPVMGEFLENTVYDGSVDMPADLALYRFIDCKAKHNLYITWSTSGEFAGSMPLDGNYWVFDTSQVNLPHPIPGKEIKPTQIPLFLSPAPAYSQVIDSIEVDSLPLTPFPSDGDLWFSTWADDNNLYSSWGDGKGPLSESSEAPWVDMGIARLTGNCPRLKAHVRYREDPAPPLEKNDKPSSLLFLDNTLYGQFHSPLGNARIGYLARSSDYGLTWEKIGFFNDGERNDQNSPWTRDKNSPFRCMFFINMGKNYELNKDGYVYALGIGTEWHWMQLGVYLTRVEKQRIGDYKAYQYFSGLDANRNPLWSDKQEDAIPLDGLMTMGQGSAMYHEGTGRYLFLTDRELFDAPHPWGPWTFAGTWTNWFTRPGITEWQGGYQPGIISKNAGDDYFWFTIAGQHLRPRITYECNLGKMNLHTKNQEPGASLPEIEGDWWRVATTPEMEKYNSPRQEPVDFSIWQAADGTWQIWSCIRNTACGGHSRLFYRWEGKRLTDAHWEPMGIAMESDPALGEPPGGLQAPYVFRENGEYFMFYGDWNRICLARSSDGKKFERVLNSQGNPSLFEGPYQNSRDPMVMKRDGLYYCYYTGHTVTPPPGKDSCAVFCRISADLVRWSEPIDVCSGGSPANGLAWYGADAECPFVIKRDGWYYLFRNQLYGPGNLNTLYVSRNPLLFGVNDDSYLKKHFPVAAPEIIEYNGIHYMATLTPALDGIRIARIKWK